jgi:long-chain acyl-CoA synthetase
MRYETWPNLATMFFDRAAELGDKPFLWAKKNDAYQPLSWRETAAQIHRLAAGLKACGIEAGDRVALVSESRPEWLIADIAIMAAGGISVPAYTTNTVDDHLHILKNSGAKGVIVSTPQLAARLIPAAEQVAESQFMVSMSPLEIPLESSLTFHGWAETLERGTEKAAEVEAWAAQLRRSDTACLIYTSGTGGMPKGVMLSHGAILSNCKGAYHLLKELGLSDEVFLSFLPLSHSYEHTAGQFFPLSIGAQIYYAEGIEHLGGNMIEARPTIMTAVPRLYESLYQRITRTVARNGGIKARLFGTALRLGSLAYETPAALSCRQRLSNRVLDLLVRRKVHGRFGGRLKALVSGGAPLNYDIGLFFTALGLRILQGYGQTESAPVISCNLPHDNRIATVGPPMIDVDVKIADDGEILVRGELVMQGYWNDTQATAATIQDGWLHTGDIGEIDGNGYIRITDRKKDIIVNSGGDNLSPQRVEGILALEPEIAQAMVYGDRKSHLVAVLVPEEGLDDATASKAALDAAMDAAVDRVNAKLSLIERVRRFILADAPFTIDNSLLTPTMKIRRHKIIALYKDRLEALYGKG